MKVDEIWEGKQKIICKNNDYGIIGIRKAAVQTIIIIS